MDYIFSFFPFSYFTTSQTNSQSNIEYSSALLIQSVYKKYQQRKEYLNDLDQIVKIQKWWRNILLNRENTKLENNSNLIKNRKNRKNNKKNKQKNKNSFSHKPKKINL
jgi:hypothetical protein